MYDLTDKLAIVTGAISKKGFGRAIANRLAKEGANVVVVDKYIVPPGDTSSDWQGLNSVVSEIESLGRRAAAISCDISNSSSVDTMIKQVMADFKTIDILVNNAGVHSYAGILTQSDDTWKRHLDVNLTGTFYCSRAAGKHMVGSGRGGRIINMGSMMSKTGMGGGQSAYCASKFAIIGLTQCMALELGQYGILVNAICPALTDTDLHKEEFEQTAIRESTNIEQIRTRFNEPVIARSPLGKLGTPEDVAAMVAFLASSQASFITGQAINVNGGIFTAH